MYADADCIIALIDIYFILFPTATDRQLNGRNVFKRTEQEAK